MNLYIRCARCTPDVTWNGGSPRVLAEAIERFVEAHTSTGCTGPFVLVDEQMRARDIEPALSTYVRELDGAGEAVPVVEAAPAGPVKALSVDDALARIGMRRVG